MIDIGKESKEQVEDYMLTRYTCYLIVQNGDSKKRRNCLLTNIFCSSN